MKKFILLCVFLVCAAAAQAVDKYWVGIGGDNETNSGGTPIFILQIDQNGNVLKAPKPAIPDSALPPGNAFDERTVAFAYSQNGNLIAYIGQDTTKDIWRVILDPNTLEMLSRKQIKTNVENLDYFQST